MTNSQKRIGLIGLSAKGSWASRSHLPYLQRTPHYTITALQNSSLASAQASAKQYSLDSASTHDSPSSVAQDPNVDIIAVSVNVPEHYALIRPALEAGKDVFCEWPLARNAEEAEELTALAKEKGIRTMVGLQARQNPSILKAKEIVESGKLGKILGTTMFGHGMIFGGITMPSYSYMHPIENGANLLTIPFGHAVDALCYVFSSELQSISAVLSNRYPELQLVDENYQPLGETKTKTSHDFVSITAELINGGGNVDVTYAPGLSRSGRDFYWEIIGSEGTLVLEGPKMGGHVQMFQPTIKIALGQEELKEVEVEKAEDFSFNVGRAWDAWAGEGKGSVTTWEDAVVRHKMIEAIYRSAEKGTREDYV
ncbi:NAD-binding Rossmann fold oxidoreductase family protein [Alternaria rosae]|uniref:NAD-binding Rossmann fold oxidoreductase family protein n=1 Tax=Alternaria rosae TaxID=1187941 RepID=UPI001E8DDC2C|nr:NAD-binding Rossmann fold oxidoreductase family protein [Alternaria rosae]KAH6872244.1 NAD-binding Rossmann fold oxidoreductase family protein [Alternaria rosae]